LFSHTFSTTARYKITSQSHFTDSKNCLITNYDCGANIDDVDDVVDDDDDDSNNNKNDSFTQTVTIQITITAILTITQLYSIKYNNNNTLMQ
jgi:hypothetical protein